MSETKDIAKALVCAQAEMTKARKDSTNPHFRSKYADLESVMDACMPALNRHGIAVYQPIVQNEFGRSVETVFLHAESGQSIRCRVPLLMQVTDNMQKLGSAITYARRYGLLMLSGTCPAEDDDGNLASQPATQPVIETPPALIRDETIQTLLGIADGLEAFSNPDVFREWVKITCKRDIGGLSESAGRRIASFLTERPDVLEWPQDFVDALTDAMQAVDQ